MHGSLWLGLSHLHNKGRLFCTTSLDISYFRIVVGLVVTVGVILLTINGIPFRATLLDIPECTSPEPEPPDPTDAHVPPAPCKCSMTSWRSKDKIVSALNLPLPWLNHTTTREDLQQRHPNLPLQLLQGPKRKRCALLPSVFRYVHTENCCSS